QAEDGIRDRTVTGVQTCALPIYLALRLPVAVRQELLNAEPHGRLTLPGRPLGASRASPGSPPARRGSGAPVRPARPGRRARSPPAPPGRGGSSASCRRVTAAPPPRR